MGKKDAIVIDVGINKTDSVVGDVDFEEVSKNAKALYGSRRCWSNDDCLFAKKHNRLFQKIAKLIFNTTKWLNWVMKKPKYPYGAILMMILTVPPISATQLGWYLYDQQTVDYGMIVGTFSVILAAWLMYEKNWREEDED